MFSFCIVSNDIICLLDIFTTDVELHTHQTRNNIMNAMIKNPEQLQRCIILATDPNLAGSESMLATATLDSIYNNTSDGGARLCAGLLLQFFPSTQEFSFQVEQKEKWRVEFYALTTIQRALSKRTIGGGCIVPENLRVELRNIILCSMLLVNNGGDENNKSLNHSGKVNERAMSCMPQFFRTKIGVVLSLLIQTDFPERWQNAFDDLIHALITTSSGVIEVIKRDVFLRTLEGFSDEVVENVSLNRNTVIKDIIRGFKPSCTVSGSNIHGKNLSSGSVVSIPVVLQAPESTLSAKIMDAIFCIFYWSYPFINDTKLEISKLPILAIGVLKRFLSWFDLSLICNERALTVFFDCLASSGSGKLQNEGGNGSPSSRLAVKVVECLREIISRGMKQEKKIRIIVELHLLERIHNCELNLDTVDETHINVVIKVAGLIDAIGQELLLYWDERFLENRSNTSSLRVEASMFTKVLQQLVPLFFKCFTYEDIDVSRAVIPLASRFVFTLQKETSVCIFSIANPNTGEEDYIFKVLKHVPRLLSVMYQQMHFPHDFGFDYENEDDAEEEIYRSDLRKLNRKIVRICPELTLQFLCNALSNLKTPLSSALTPDIEAALRLVFHYCEGVQASQGIKIVMKNERFCELLLWLHRSDVTFHPHREVLILYYDIVVRYSDILKVKPDFLPSILSAMSGTSGLQHPHPRVRSRSCYLLLKLIKVMKKLMRPYVEIAVKGIQGLLSNISSLPLDPDDALNLFESIGFLLGKTGLDFSDEQRYLTSVIDPIMKQTEAVLTSSNLHRNANHFGVLLASSVAAIAFLSKGYSKHPPPHVQVVLLETVPVSLSVLQSLPTHEPVRNKVMIYLQRMILCLGNQVLSSMPNFIETLIDYCDDKDIIDVAQILYQICIKFRENAKTVINRATLPFLRKCHTLIHGLVQFVDQGFTPPHLLTEQLAIRKLIFIFLYQVVNNQCTEILLSATNAPSLGDILRAMGDGAITIEDPVIKRTCLQFFRELVYQWGAECLRQGENWNAIIGFMHYIFVVFIPGMIGCMLKESFDEQDAMQNRNISEMGIILFTVKEKCGPDEFEEKVLKGILPKFNCPPYIITTFHQAHNSGDMESCLKALLHIIKDR